MRLAVRITNAHRLETLQIPAFLLGTAFDQIAALQSHSGSDSQPMICDNRLFLVSHENSQLLAAAE